MEWVTYQHDEEFYDTRRQLGFKLQDRVSIANRFFRDHRIPITYLGQGVVIAKILPNAETLPALLIEFPVHPMILTHPEFRKLIIPMSQQSRDRKTIIIRIHPLYVELVERSDGKKKRK